MKQKTEQLLCSARDEAQAGLIAGMLESAGIPYILRRPGPGMVYNSPLIFGVNVYVAPDGYQEAKALLDGYFAQTQELLDDTDDFS